MKLFLVPTYYAIYQVTDPENGTLKLIRECKRKGEAMKWIDRSGERGVSYHVRTLYKRNN